MSGHPWRTRSIPNVGAEVERCRDLFPQIKEIFFHDDTFPWAKARTLDVCQAFKPLKLTWSCNSRVHTDYETLKAMKEAGFCAQPPRSTIGRDNWQGFTKLSAPWRDTV